jgi:hypothetical protein
MVWGKQRPFPVVRACCGDTSDIPPNAVQSKNRYGRRPKKQSGSARTPTAANQKTTQERGGGILMKEKLFRAVFFCAVLFLISSIHACNKTAASNTYSLTGDFQIHIISFGQVSNYILANGKPPDILSQPQYIISDEQIISYDWSRQLIAFDNSIQEMYIINDDFLDWSSKFAIVWNGKIVAEGKIMDTVSPEVTTYPVVYVLEPRGDPQFPSSAHRTIGATISDPDLIKNLSILLRVDNQHLLGIGLEDNVTDIVFDEQIAEEIKNHFQQDGRLID